MLMLKMCHDHIVDTYTFPVDPLNGCLLNNLTMCIDVGSVKTISVLATMLQLDIIKTSKSSYVN